MNSRNELQRQYRTQATLAVSRWLFVALIVIIGIVVWITTPRAKPPDDSVIKNAGIVRQIHVVDSTNNGFRVVYATKGNVTADRLHEIQFRPAIRDSLERLKAAAPLRFGDMLHTDIYDFAEFAVPFDPTDVRIHNIFVFGREKENLYVGDNPRLENEAKWINPGTAQGLLYLTAKEIYYHTSRRRKVYRYFKCRGLDETSDTDEHFSHFTEEERIY
ncbi:MAG: hypothetical protein LBV18_02110 [Alistipes sp.]|jgi:hypothetical protein|nr:hypothetical protein [Alistipes sp.]